MIRKAQETKRILALDNIMLDNELKSREIINKMTNPSVCKMIVWEIDIMNNKLQSLERRPEIYNDWEDTIFEEISLTQAIERVNKHDTAEGLL